MSNYLKNELGFKYPIYWNDWALEKGAVDLLVYTILTKRPKVIVDLGSGLSTLVATKLLSDMGVKDFVVYSVDTSIEFLNETKNRIFAENENLLSHVVFIEAPIEDVKIGSKNFKWYRNFDSEIKSNKIDLVIVDGPIGTLCDHARYPALPILKNKLKKGSVLLLDDYNRPDEREIVENWCSEFGVKSLVRSETKRGIVQVII